MALNLTNIDYAGKELAIDIIRQVYDENLFFTNFGARRVPGVKGKYFYWDMTLDAQFNCDNPVCPTFDTDFTLNQNNGELCKYHVSGSIDHDSLLNSARERFYKPGVLNESVEDDTEVFDTFIEMLMGSINEKLDEVFINGDSTYDCCDGLIKQFEDGTLARPIPAGQLLTGVAITPSNVQAEMSKVINALPSKYRKGKSVFTEKAKFAVASNIYDSLWESYTYQAPVAAAGALGANLDETGVARYRGYEVVEVDVLADDTMFYTSPQNILIVEDDDADKSRLLIKNGLNDSTLCAKINYRIDWRSAIFFGIGEAIVYYR